MDIDRDTVHSLSESLAKERMQIFRGFVNDPVGREWV